MIAILVTATLWAQASFEVATVKPSAPETRGVSVYVFPGGRVLVQHQSLARLVQESLQVQAFQVSGGPDWIYSQDWDIDARPPEGSKARQYQPADRSMPMLPEQRDMMLSLLTERFHLAFHRDTRQGPVLILRRVPGKKLGLQEVEPREARQWVGDPPGGFPTGNGLAGRNITMPTLAKRLSGFLSRPVIDKTGLMGTYDFRVVLRDDAPARLPDADIEASILIAVEQLGLKLERTTGPVETIVIDHAERPVADAQ
jgi:uncharacterized protein (TIGR03435 family)